MTVTGVLREKKKRSREEVETHREFHVTEVENRMMFPQAMGHQGVLSWETVRSGVFWESFGELGLAHADF